MLLLRTNSKSHIRFLLAPISVTLDDLERQKRPLLEIEKSCGVHRKLSTKIDLCYKLQNVRPRDLFLLRDALAERGDVTVSRLSVRPSVRP